MINSIELTIKFIEDDSQQKLIINYKKNRIEKIDSQISFNNPIRKLDLIKNKLILHKGG